MYNNKQNMLYNQLFLYKYKYIINIQMYYLFKYLKNIIFFTSIDNMHYNKLIILNIKNFKKIDKNMEICS